MEKIKIKDGSELYIVIRKRVAEHGADTYLNDLDVSDVITFSYMFHDIDWSGDLSGWDMSHAIYTNHMFMGSTFNGDISAWDVGMECRMPGMFVNSVLAAGMGRSYHKDPAGMKVLLLRSLMDGKPVEGTYGLLHAVADGMDTRIFNKDI